MKRIGVFLDVEPPGGGTFQYNQAILEAVSVLPRDRFSVIVAYTSKIWQEFLKDYELQHFMISKGIFARALGVIWRLASLPTGAWRTITPLFHPMAKELLRQRCDLWIFPSQDGRGYEFPVPALISIHDLMHRYERRFPEVGSEREYGIRERHYRDICTWSMGILVDSEVGRQQVMESYGLSEKRIHVLPYVATHHLRKGMCSPEFEKRYKLPSKFLFYPAQFWEHKNHVNLVSAIASLKSQIPDMKLVLTGSRKNAYDAVMAKIEKLGLRDDILCMDYVADADMPEFYRRARALVMPTFFGPTNIPPLEAFAAGCPVAVSNIYAMSEQVGDAALLFNPESVDELAVCIRRLWTDDVLCSDLIRRGHRKAAMWGPEQFSGRLQSILETITDSSKHVKSFMS